MRYAAAEKLEIIQLAEQSAPVGMAHPAQLGIPRSTFYCCGTIAIEPARRGRPPGLQPGAAAGVGINSRGGHPKRCLSSRSKSRSYRRGSWPSRSGDAAAGISFPGGLRCIKALEGARPDHQSRLHPEEGVAGQLRPSNHRTPISSGKPTLPTCG